MKLHERTTPSLIRHEPESSFQQIWCHALQGTELPARPGEGILALTQPWPSMMRTLRGDHERFEKTYFSTFHGKYFTGDGARIDGDGYVWITGRVDVCLSLCSSTVFKSG